MRFKLMANAPEQLVLELPHRPAMGLEDFLVSASNEAAVALVDRWPDWAAGAAVLSGPKGSGKTHLAHVWRLRSNATMVPAREMTRAGVPDIADRGAIVVEDIHALDDEPALFHLLNLVREQRLAVLLTSDMAPGDLAVQLPDLRSRLKALPFVSIAPPDDTLLRAVLVKLFSDRQLSVEPHIIDYVVVRMERSMSAAQHLVGEVDRRALMLQRGVTRAIAAAALEAVGGPASS